VLNDTYKFGTSQKDGSRTKLEIPQTACCKARARLVISNIDTYNSEYPFQNHYMLIVKYIYVHGRRKDFFQGGPIADFPGIVKKIFSEGGQT